MVGLQTSRSEIDAVAGSIARDLNVLMKRVTVLKAYLDQTPDADLTAMGYTAQDVALLKSAFADAAQLEAIFRGAGTLADAKDFRAFLRQVWGLGGI